MTDAELLDAARTYAGQEPNDMMPLSKRGAIAFARHILTTVKPDDGEAVSVSWLESVGYSRRMQPASDCRLSSRETIPADNGCIIPVVQIDFPKRCKGRYVVWVYGWPEEKEATPTRGDVRRLCAALGIDLKEGA